MKSGALKLFFALAALMAVTLLVVYLSRLGEGVNTGAPDARRQAADMQQVQTYHETVQQRERTRQAREQMRRKAGRQSRVAMKPLQANVTDAAALERKKAAHKPLSPQEAALRNEIRYRVDVFAHKPEAAVRQLQNALRRAGVSDAFDTAAMRGEFMIPREAYLKFSGELQSLGDIKVERIRYRSPEAPASPVPFEIHIKQK